MKIIKKDINAFLYENGNVCKDVTKSLRLLKSCGYDISDKKLREEVRYFFSSNIKYVNKIASIINKGEKKTKETILHTEQLDKKIKVPYEIVDNKYVISCSKGEIKLSINQVDELFYQFSKHGLNLTSTQIINRNNFLPWQWHAIKNALDLYKHSNIYSAYTLNNLSESDKEEKVSGKIKEALNNKNNIENVYNQTVIKEYKRIINSYNEKKLFFQGLELGLLDIKDKFKHQEVLHFVTSDANSIPEINVFLADLHAGAEVRGLFVTENYNLQILKEKLDTIAIEVNKLQAKRVNLFFLGDIIESFTGMNHKNTWQEMEKGLYGANLVKVVIDLLVDFISKVHNINMIYAIGGNHDRGDSNNLVDYKGEIAGIIFAWLNSLLPFEVKFDFSLVNPTIDGISYICMHGHNKEINLNPEQIILNYGKQGNYNLVVSGHLHTLKIKADTHNYRQIVCPSVFPGNSYSERNGWTSNSGFMVTYNNGKGKPNINIYSI